MSEVFYTIKEAAALLQLNTETLLRYIRGKPGEEKRFPRAFMPYNSRKYGYRIPANDLLALAERESPWLVNSIREDLANRRSVEDPNLQAVS